MPQRISTGKWEGILARDQRWHANDVRAFTSSWSDDDLTRLLAAQEGEDPSRRAAVEQVIAERRAAAEPK
jgi:hypothetical protein